MGIQTQAGAAAQGSSPLSQPLRLMETSGEQQVRILPQPHFLWRENQSSPPLGASARSVSSPRKPRGGGGKQECTLPCDSIRPRHWHLQAKWTPTSYTESPWSSSSITAIRGLEQRAAARLHRTEAWGGRSSDGLLNRPLLSTHNTPGWRRKHLRSLQVSMYPM